MTVDEADEQFEVEISGRWWAKLVELERQTGLSKDEIVERLVLNANVEEVLQRIKELDKEKARKRWEKRRARRWRG